MNQIKVKALAKINLGLDVLGKREDGYHEVRMIMQTVNLYDTLELQKKSEPGIFMKTNRRFLPVDEKNLCVRAAKLLWEEFSLPGGLSVSLYKRIPVAAGMAGGSTDAAAVLFAVNRMFGLGLTREQLMERGVKIGADVPYCVMRGTALAEGIGERLSPLAPMVKCPVLVAKPGVSVSTKTVYQQLDLQKDIAHPDIDRLCRDIEKGNLAEIAAHMGNILETVTIPMHPVIRDIKEHMLRHGALNAMMSGSGPTVFGLFEDQKSMRRAKDALSQSGLAAQVYATTIFNNRRQP